MSFFKTSDRTYSATGGEGFEAAPEAPAYRTGYMRVFGFDGKWQESMISPVTRAEGRLALHRAGLLAQIEAVISQADAETRIWYEDAQVWERDHPVVISIGAALGLTPEQIDNLFISAQ